tara:strand:+ start:324 stop:488 length:165 start_codon:yes stop_codon:yes gene_type:complete
MNENDINPELISKLKIQEAKLLKQSSAMALGLEALALVVKRQLWLEREHQNNGM